MFIRAAATKYPGNLAAQLQKLSVWTGNVDPGCDQQEEKEERVFQEPGKVRKALANLELANTDKQH